MTTPMDLPADVFVGILLRLPPSSRRLTRLVCRQWRDVVDTRTAEMQSRAKPLVANAEGSVYIVDDLSTGSHRFLWKNDTLTNRGTMVVGTCNGLICLCDNRPKPDGAITLVNPVTGEKLALPPLPWATVRDYRTVSPHKKYGFAYHPTTGRHKVVHVAAYGKKGDPQVKVFTLGDASWRYVATAPGPRCDYNVGVVGVDGIMYWAAKSGKKLMAFDLYSERLKFIKSLPDVTSDSWYLDEVQGRLGMLFFHSEAQKCEVWVLEGAKTMGEHKWSCLYIVGRRIPQHSSSRVWHITWNVVNKHKSSNDSGVAKTSEKSPGMIVCMKACWCYHRQTFAYVETTEPLNIYRCWS